SWTSAWIAASSATAAVSTVRKPAAPGNNGLGFARLQLDLAIAPPLDTALAHNPAGLEAETDDLPRLGPGLGIGPFTVIGDLQPGLAAAQQDVDRAGALDRSPLVPAERAQRDDQVGALAAQRRGGAGGHLGGRGEGHRIGSRDAPGGERRQ